MLNFYFKGSEFNPHPSMVENNQNLVFVTNSSAMTYDKKKKTDLQKQKKTDILKEKKQTEKLSGDS